jgi:putative ABC transport system ATP-binding protein
MVFQNYAVFPHLTVFQNIAFGLRMKHTDAKVIDERVRWAAALVELSDLLERRPGQLSGGQRQRVAVARALANEPLIVLADEPTGNLDSAATLDVLRLFDGLHDAGQTLVIVTHDSRIAATADRLITMRDGAFVDETRLTGGTAGSLGKLAGLES